MTSELLISIRNGHFYQELTPILGHVHCQIHRGEFVYLVGMTGSGKSTLLKTLYADIPIIEGDVDVVGYSLTHLRRKDLPYLRRKIGIVFQDFQLFFDRTVSENLMFVMRATGWKNAREMKQRLSDVLMKVGLIGKESKMPHQLSGGEQQRVVIARALVNDPQVILADEPTGNLDPSISAGIVRLFREINQTGTAVVMATHNHQFIEKFPSRVLKCEGGRLLDSDRDKFDIETTQV